MKKYQIIDRHGRLVERDEVEDDTVPLRDGERLRVPLLMMDSLQRVVAEGSCATADAVFITDASGARFVLADALGRTDRASLARDNGFRFLLPVGDRAEGAMAVQRMQRAEARRELHDRMTNAWRGDVAPPCDAQPTFDAAEGARRKREAYEAMCHDQANAWRSRK